MDNIAKIKRFSKRFHVLLSVLMVLTPLFFVLYWTFINYLPETFMAVNRVSKTLIPNPLTPMEQLLGYVASLFPMAALLYGLANIRRLFSFYMQGIIFSLEHVSVFKKIARALILYVVFSVLYRSAQSVIFSLGNPPGERVLSVGVGSEEIFSLMVGAIALLISWVMEEGRIISEENQLTV
jgi:hypothetical protein